MRLIALSLLAVSCSSPPAPRTPVASTTLDPTIQTIVREELDRAVAEWKPSVAVAIVLDARTGAVLASDGREGSRSDASIPTTPTFITGSTLKTLTFAAALRRSRRRRSRPTQRSTARRVRIRRASSTTRARMGPSLSPRCSRSRPTSARQHS